MKKKNSFLLYKDLCEVVDEMTVEQAGYLLKAIYQYQLNGNVLDVPPEIRFTLKHLIAQFKRDNIKYAEISKKRSAAGIKSAEQKLTSAGKRKHVLTNATDSDSVSDSVSDINKLPRQSVELSDKIIDHVREINPSARNINPPKLEKTRLTWAKAIDKANRIDGRSWEELNIVLRFALADEFWGQNILSGTKFRDKYDDLYVRMSRSNCKAPFKLEKEPTWDAN